MKTGVARSGIGIFGKVYFGYLNKHLENKRELK